MPQGPGTYGTKRGRPPVKKQAGGGMGVRQIKANAANLGRNIARKPIGDPTGLGLRGKTLTGGTMQSKRNVGTLKRGGMVPSSAQTSVIKGAKAPGSREGSTIGGPKAKGSREGSVIKAKDGKWIQKAIKKPGALRASLGIKKGKDIPAKKLNVAAKKKGKLGQRARLAKTLKSFA
jgi:hypothetical protein